MYKDAKQAYDAANTTQFKMKLNQKTDADIIAKLDNEWNKQGYVKYLIRKDIEANGIRTRYRIVKFQNACGKAYLNDLTPGVSLDIGDDRGYDDFEIIQVFESKKEAFDTFKEYRSTVQDWGYDRFGNAIYEIVEYAIEIYEVDENGEFDQGSDYEFAPFENLAGILPDKIEIEQYPSNVTVHIYEAGDADQHVRVFLDMDGLECEDEDDCITFAENDVDTVENELGRRLIGGARDDLRETLENYYSWKRQD